MNERVLLTTYELTVTFKVNGMRNYCHKIYFSSVSVRNKIIELSKYDVEYINITPVEHKPIGYVEVIKLPVKRMVARSVSLRCLMNSKTASIMDLDYDIKCALCATHLVSPGPLACAYFNQARQSFLHCDGCRDDSRPIGITCVCGTNG